MAKPAAVQKLKHGKALCGKTFGRFVETFNWLVDFCQGLQGDKDANNANGRISLDRSDESAPVIRLSAGAGGNGGGGGGGGDGSGCWQLVLDEDEETASLVSCWCNVGGMSRYYGNFDVTSLVTGATGILCARLSSGSATPVMYSNLLALNSAQEDESAYVVPLYEITNGEVATDLRNAPQIQVFEGSL